MSKLTLDEAIKHCLEVANSKEMEAEFETDYVCYFMTDKEREECEQCAAEHRQLAEWLTELKEAKRLLKAAVEDIYKARQGCNCNICDMPPEPTERCQYENGEDCQFKWRYADEALKLIES